MDLPKPNMAWMLQVLLLFFITVTCVTSKTLTECFYEIATINGVTYLASMFCQYGCCGTSQDQRCCTRDEKYPKEDEGRAWRIVALAFAGVIIVLALSLVACWLLKKKNKKNVRVRTTNYSGAASQQQRHGQYAQPDIFTLTFRELDRSSFPPAYSDLPKYSETTFNNGQAQNQTPGYGAGYSTDGATGYSTGPDNPAPEGGRAAAPSDNRLPTSPPPSYTP